MNDDIVTRLRRALDIWLSHGEVDDLAWTEAADEIERLQAELSLWKQTAKHVRYHHTIEALKLELTKRSKPK